MKFELFSFQSQILHSNFATMNRVFGSLFLCRKILYQVCPRWYRIRWTESSTERSCASYPLCLLYISNRPSLKDFLLTKVVFVLSGTLRRQRIQWARIGSQVCIVFRPHEHPSYSQAEKLARSHQHRTIFTHHHPNRLGPATRIQFQIASSARRVS